MGAAGLLASAEVGATCPPLKRVVAVTIEVSDSLPDCAPGFAPKENRLRDAGGAAAGVVVPVFEAEVLKRVGAAGVAGAGFAPVAAGCAANRAPEGAGAFSAGFAPKRLAVGVVVFAVGVEVSFPPNKLVPAGLAPKRLVPVLEG